MDYNDYEDDLIEFQDDDNKNDTDIIDLEAEVLENKPTTEYSKDNKFGQREFEKRIGNKNYYKDNDTELKEKKREAKDKKNEAKEELKKAKEAKKEARKKKWEADGKEEKKAARKDYRNSKKELKKAKKNYKKAKKNYSGANNGLINNRINDIKSKMYQISNPFEALKSQVKNKAKNAAKNVAKKAGKGIAKGTKAIGSKLAGLIAAHPVVALVILLVILVIVILVVIITVVIGGSGSMSGAPGQGITSSQCNYGTRGINDETVVELINCEATKDNYTVLQTIPLEKYIAGVAIAEMGESYVDEAMKAQLVAVRSYTLTRNIPEYSAGYDSSKNVIRMRACENDQVYWDYTKDIYRSANAVRNGVSKYSPEYTPAEGETPWKKALTTEQINKYEALVSTVMGEFLVDSNDNVIATGYTNTETQKFIEIANNNAGTENGKYTAILLNVYGSSKVNEAVCTVAYSGATGEFTTWKQKTSYGAPWAGVKIGYDKENNKNITINDVGCLIVSISMQITNSGVPTGEIVDFNPGTFAEALKANGNISSSGALNSWEIEKIIPDFKYVGTKYFSYDKNNFESDKLKNYQTIKSYADQGYYIVIEVRKHGGGQHWVALDVANSQNANWQDIYIWDPATNYTSIGAYSKYRANRIAYYKVEKGETT